MTTFELTPNDSHKSFYGKAIVIADANGETLYSYSTPVMHRCIDGTLLRLWGGWSATTGRHVTAFCGLHKKEYMALRPLNL